MIRDAFWLGFRQDLHVTACRLVLLGIPVALYLHPDSPRPWKLGIPNWGLLNRLYAGYSRAEFERCQHHWFQGSVPLTCQAGQQPEIGAVLHANGGQERGYSKLDSIMCNSGILNCL